MKPLLILCLGNEVLCDDTFGPTVAEKLLADDGLGDSVEVIFAALAGFRLLDLMQGKRRVLVVDSIRTEPSHPGELHFFPLGDMTPSTNLVASHQLNLPTALELGRRLGYEMPAEVDVLAVEVADIETLSEEMTPAVAASVAPAIDRIKAWVVRQSMEIDHEENRKRTDTVT